MRIAQLGGYFSVPPGFEKLPQFQYIELFASEALSPLLVEMVTPRRSVFAL